METRIQHIEIIFKRLQELYQEHLAAFETQELPDLEKQSADRKIELERFIKGISEVIHLAETDKHIDMRPVLGSFRDLIALLLEQNAALENRVRDFRDRMKTNMDRISKGKQVIGSYRSSAKVLNAPKVIHVTQ